MKYVLCSTKTGIQTFESRYDALEAIMHFLGKKAMLCYTVSRGKGEHSDFVTKHTYELTKEGVTQKVTFVIYTE